MMLKGLAAAGALMMGLAGSVGFADSASASPAAPACCQYSATSPTWWSIQGTVDNDPGSGATAWVWGANYQKPGAAQNELGFIKVEYYNGSYGDLTGIAPGQSKSMNLPADVWRFMPCFTRDIQQGAVDYCPSTWTNVP